MRRGIILRDGSTSAEIIFWQRQRVMCMQLSFAVGLCFRYWEFIMWGWMDLAVCGMDSVVNFGAAAIIGASHLN